MTTIRKIQQLEKSKEVLDRLTEELRAKGYKKFQAERVYRIALAKKELTFKSRGNNYPAAMVSDMARGDENVSDLRYKRDIALIEFEICREKLRNERMQIESLRSLIAWDRANYLNT